MTAALRAADSLMGAIRSSGLERAPVGKRLANHATSFDCPWLGTWWILRYELNLRQHHGSRSGKLSRRHSDMALSRQGWSRFGLQTLPRIGGIGRCTTHAETLTLQATERTWIPPMTGRKQMFVRDELNNPPALSRTEAILSRRTSHSVAGPWFASQANFCVGPSRPDSLFGDWHEYLRPPPLIWAKAATEVWSTQPMGAGAVPRKRKDDTGRSPWRRPGDNHRGVDRLWAGSCVIAPASACSSIRRIGVSLQESGRSSGKPSWLVTVRSGSDPRGLV